MLKFFIYLLFLLINFIGFYKFKNIFIIICIAKFLLKGNYFYKQIYWIELFYEEYTHIIEYLNLNYVNVMLRFFIIIIYELRNQILNENKFKRNYYEK